MDEQQNNPEKIPDAPFVADQSAYEDEEEGSLLPWVDHSRPQTGDRVMVLRDRCSCPEERELTDQELLAATNYAIEVDGRVTVMVATTEPSSWVVLGVVDWDGICPPF